MRRLLVLLMVLPALLWLPGQAHAAAYSSSFGGTVAGYRLAGVEPDGDPLYQVVLQTKLAGNGGLPPINLIVSSYLENFRPDTTPILPDLLHPARTATDLGGFLQGKALLTDDAGNVLYIGSFLAEAFLNNTNHAVMQLFGSGTSYGGSGRLKGTFTLDRKGRLSGHLTGTLKIAAAALRQIELNRGAKLKPLKQIISVVSVTPHYYGTKGVKGTGAPLHTGYGPGGNSAPSSTSTGTRISPWTIIAGTGAVVSLLLAGLLYLWERRRERAGSAPAS